MKQAIENNRRRVARQKKYRAVMRRIVLNWWHYVDAGLEAKAQRVKERCIQKVNR